MGIFSNILSKLGIGESVSPAPVDATPTTDATSTEPSGVETASTPVAISNIDVMSQLEKLANAHAERLNWKVSIVDLLKLLDLDSSLATRKSLATELGCSAESMSDSATMNIWLHQTVLQKLAENGGNIPADLLK
jgi:Domain of unknown function (DUF3597)